MEEYTTNLIKNYPFTIQIQRSHKKGEYDKKRVLCEDIFTFDIETTSFFYDADLKPFMYEPGYDPDYWCGIQAGAIPYIWQFGVNNSYYYGRDIKDFRKVLDDFPSDMHVRIFIHHLAFEWHFLDFLTWDKVFAKTPHKPIKASCKEYPNIEFICTLSLENMSLASWGKALGIPKKVGDLAYNVMRTPLTPLTDTELGYCQRDLEVMYIGLKEELKTYGSVHKLPLTSTGKVRKVVKDLLMLDKEYVNYIHSLVPENPYQYKTSMLVYAGGYTHANRSKVGFTFVNEDGKHGGHYDYTSSYPYEMAVMKGPCTKWAYFGHDLPDPETFEDHAYKMHLSFKKIKCQLQNTYIAISHCIKDSLHNIKADNGRLISADTVELWCTEQDFTVISKAYIWEELEVVECWEAEKDYLPINFVNYVLELFHAKSAYKNVPGMEDIYKKSKSYINSLYGMAVTSLLMSDVVWDDESGTWHIQRITEQKLIEHLGKIAKYSDKRYFLNYDWGVWISNGARCRLWNDLIIPYDNHVIYADTDSIFTDIAIDFTDYNKKIDERLKKVCDERGLDFEKTRPANPKGQRSYLGHLTIEPEWQEFRTLGAKRYVERRTYKEGDPEQDGKLHLTLSGINKEAVSCLNDDIENFRNGCVFDKDEADVSKLLHTYFDNQPLIRFPDGYISDQKRGVNLRPNGYKLTMDKSYDDILQAIGMNIYNEHYEQHIRGIWDEQTIDLEEINDIINDYMERG